MRLSNQEYKLFVQYLREKGYAAAPGGMTRIPMNTDSITEHPLYKKYLQEVKPPVGITPYAAKIYEQAGGKLPAKTIVKGTAPDGLSQDIKDMLEANRLAVLAKQLAKPPAKEEAAKTTAGIRLPPEVLPEGSEWLMDPQIGYYEAKIKPEKPEKPPTEQDIATTEYTRGQTEATRRKTISEETEAARKVEAEKKTAEDNKRIEYISYLMNQRNKNPFFSPEWKRVDKEIANLMQTYAPSAVSGTVAPAAPPVPGISAAEKWNQPPSMGQQAPAPYKQRRYPVSNTPGIKDSQLYKTWEALGKPGLNTRR